MVSLKGQTVLVTGANSGIGSEIARAMARAGANVAVNYVAHEEVTRRMIGEIRGEGGRAMGIRADVADEGQVIEMFETVMSEYGTIDILVSNAGIQKDSAFVEMTLEQWKNVLDVNLTGAFLCARQAAREFLRRGVVADRSVASGKIIFISSVHEVIPWARHANYAASKGGIHLLMRTLAQELAPRKVRVNSIAPGAVKTGINKAAWDTPSEADGLRKLIPYGRIGETKDIAPVAVWLASDEADYLNGTTIYVDGGMLLYPGFRTGG